MPLTREILKRYPNPVFIETGTYRGEGILCALAFEFKMIYSIELSEYYYKKNLFVFKDFPNVKLLQGDSRVVLRELLKEINEPVTFWLDAHYSEQGTADNGSPLLYELKAISEHHIKTHTIMIDDIDMYCSKIEIVSNIFICRQ